MIVALTFVAAPFYLRQAQAGFEALDRTWLDASRTLGAGEARTFARVAIPAAGPSLVAGVALAWGRALGEFGATLMFAGSFRGVTQTVPLAIYERFSTDFTGALALSAVLVAVSARPAAVGQAAERLGVARRCCALRPPRGSAPSRSTSRSRSPPGACLALAGPVGRGQDVGAAGRRRSRAPRARARGLRRGDLARHRAAHRPRARAASLRLRLPGATRSSPTCASGRTSPTRCAGLRPGAAAPARAGAARALRHRPPGRRAAARRSRAASASASRSPARWPGARPRCCSTSRCRRSTRARAPRRDASSPPCWPRPACRRCSSRTTSPRRRCSATASASSTAAASCSGAPRPSSRPSPASAFVADFTGAVVLTGTARPAHGGLTASRSTAAARC